MSSLDPPTALAVAEVNYEVDMDGSHITPDEPYSTVVQGDIEALAAACGLQ